MMQTTQNRLSTGKKVNSALDDPVNFFKAEDHYNRASDLAAKKDGMSRSHQVPSKLPTPASRRSKNLLAQMKSLASGCQNFRQHKSDLSRPV